MEMLYKVNEKDEVLGSIERNKAHKQGVLHRSGAIYLFRSDGQLLIQTRSKTKETFPDCYDSSAAFHVTYGESYEEAAKRELKEETGISAPLRYVGKFTHFNPPENEIVAVFVAQSNNKIKIDKKETASAMFYPKEKVAKMAASKKASPWFRDSWKLMEKTVYSERTKESEIMGLIQHLGKKLPKFDDGRINYKSSKIAPVINIFVRHKDKILLLKRSNKVTNYSGIWNNVSGYFDEIKSIKDKAMEEVSEEIGIVEKNVSSIKIGEPFGLTDAKIKKVWVICPVLIDLKTKPEVKLNYEHTQYKWINPKDLAKFETVPGLARNLAAVTK